MRDLVSNGKRDFRVHAATGRLVRQCQPKDYLCYARRIFEFCRDEIQYVFDPVGVEMIEAPYRILQSRVADCDSIVVLLAAMLESIGFPCEFVCIKADLNRLDQWSHVFLRCRVPKSGWVEMDATMHDRPFGWAPPESYERGYWPASNDRPEEREGDKMSGFAELPHVEFAKGQVPGGIWNWRQEAAASVTDSPETLELSQLGNQPQGLPSALPGESFFQAVDASRVFSVLPAISAAQTLPAKTEAVLDVSSDKAWAQKLYALAALVGLWLIWRR